jgi:hypothetical protein
LCNFQQIGDSFSGENSKKIKDRNLRSGFFSHKAKNRIIEIKTFRIIGEVCFFLFPVLLPFFVPYCLIQCHLRDREIEGEVRGENGGRERGEGGGREGGGGGGGEGEGRGGVVVDRTW